MPDVIWGHKIVARACWAVGAGRAGAQVHEIVRLISMGTAAKTVVGFNGGAFLHGQGVFVDIEEVLRVVRQATIRPF
jgi:hypothetical protein